MTSGHHKADATQYKSAEVKMSTVLSQSAEATLLVRTSPEALRELANQLDIRARYAVPGQTIMTRMTPQITLLFDPNRSLEKFVQNLAGEFLPTPEPASSDTHTPT